MMNGDPPKLLDANHALSHYLDSLLQELSGADTVPRFEAIPGSEEDAAGFEGCSDTLEGLVLQKRLGVEHRPGFKVWPEFAEIPGLNAVAGLADLPAVIPPPAREPAPVHEPAPQAVSAPPVWAQQRFQCLSFQVAGLTLAVPLTRLNGIIEATDPITPMPGHQPWFLGLIQHLGRQVKVVDIGLIVVPRNRSYHPVPPRYIVLLEGYRWGLACEGITGMLTLDPEQARWRSRRGRRPWLAGTVIDHMCAILDVDRLALDLDSGAWGSSARNGVSDGRFGPGLSSAAGNAHREPGPHPLPIHPQQRNDES